MHHYPFHHGDYLKSTAHLDPMEDLAYRRLLDLYYEDEAPLPLETQQVSRRIRLGSELVSKMLSEFFEKRETGWHQGRCDREIARYKARAERSKQNGSVGGRPRKTQKKPSGLSEGEQKPLTRTKNQEPIFPDGFPESHKPAMLLWWKHKTERGESYKPTGWEQLLKSWASRPTQEVVLAVEFSIQQNYQGLFPPKKQFQDRPSGKRQQSCL